MNENIDSITQNSILPPSKLEIGSRFNIPRKREDKINSSPKANERKGVNRAINAHKRFIAGPAAQINISFEKEPRFVFGTRDAPNGDNLISLNLTLDMRAAAICPSSWIKADKKHARASKEWVIISANVKAIAKKPILIFINILSIKISS